MTYDGATPYTSEEWRFSTAFCPNGFPTYDFAGPDGVGETFRDCIVNFYDFAAFASGWMTNGF